MNFIHQQKIKNLALCQEIFNFFKAHPELTKGKTSNFTSSNIINKKTKDSRDIWLSKNKDLFDQYVNNLVPVVEAYKKKFPFCDEYAPWGILEEVNVQFYSPGGGYHSWHTERSSGKGIFAARHLVFMTYLNDVTDCGETEFLHQNIKVTPEQGLTLIWPVDWTYTHRGIASPTQEKAIVTGWFSFLK